MPFTFFHYGPALFVGLIVLSYINLPTLIIATTVVDIEPLLVQVLKLDAPHHGLTHTFLGGALIATALAVIMCRLMSKEKKSKIWIASITGIFLHVLVDAPMYDDIRPFYPFDINPFFTGYGTIRISLLLFLGALLIAGYMLTKKRLRAQLAYRGSKQAK
jgi:membrane-bound metal-dependent hydrolase YbcI (DUF457 family)